ncbi:hypothetical protein ACLKA6_004386 [Drosophila palustris]
MAFVAYFAALCGDGNISQGNEIGFYSSNSNRNVKSKGRQAKRGVMHMRNGNRTDYRVSPMAAGTTGGMQLGKLLLHVHKPAPANAPKPHSSTAQYII